MSRRLIVPIVEGHGEQKAVPGLIRRWLHHRRFDCCFEVADPAVNAKSCSNLKAAYDRRRHIGIEHYVESALRSQPDAILVILDADKECLNRPRGAGLGPELLARARAVTEDVPISVVVANRTYEAWLLASGSALSRSKLIRRPAGLGAIQDPEVRAGSKGAIGDYMEQRYSPPAHQHLLTETISFSTGAQKRSPSFAKLLRDLKCLTEQARARRSR